MSKKRILVVDDAAVIRRMVSKIIDDEEDYEVIGIAANGNIALRKFEQLKPDLITLDIEMPDRDGISTLKEIRKTNSKIPIIMLSSLTKTGAEKTFEALQPGATDYLAKPSKISDFLKSIDELKRLLIPRINAHFPKEKESTVTRHNNPKKSTRLNTQRVSFAPPEILCIGSSTGGPNALGDLIKNLNERLPIPTVIVQHMPPVFTKTLADRLDKLSPNTCYEAKDGQSIQPGCVYIAPGGKHMELVRESDQTVIRLNENSPENSCRPSVDPLFRSVSQIYGSKTLALVLTGMGRDGLNGCEHISETSGQIIVQDRESSVVWGMPRSVAEAGLADQILPLDEIPKAILEAQKTVIHQSN